MSKPILPSCPYSTYQRATAGHSLRSLSARLVIRLVRAKFLPAARKDKALRPFRKAVYRGALKHWRNDCKILAIYRL